MRPRCFLGGVACEKRDRRWRIRAAEGPARGVKWFGSMDDGCVASCVACASHASCATSQTSFGAEVRNWDAANVYDKAIQPRRPQCTEVYVPALRRVP